MAANADARPSSQLASFPAEILGEIFTAAIPHLRNHHGLRAHFPWALSHVCRHWRTTALSFQKLWVFLDLEQPELQPVIEAAHVTKIFPIYSLMEEYLSRSGNRPLTFRMAYPSNDDIGYDDERSRGILYHSFFKYLSRHSSRWENIHLESLALPADEILGEDEEGKYPNLRSVTFSYCVFGSQNWRPPCLAGIPWSQLTRYHEYQCSWGPDDERFWEIIGSLTNVVDLRAGFVWFSGLSQAIRLPHLRFASFEIRRHAIHTFTIEELLDDFDVPRLEGLNLKLHKDYQRDVLLPVPEGLKALKILRLCGNVTISRAAFQRILMAIPTLTDFPVEMKSINAQDLFALLTPTSGDVVLVPRLQALCITQFENRIGAFDALLDMLRARFRGIPEADFSPLQLFSFWTRLHVTPSTILEGLRSLQQREGWDIRIDEDWRGDFWKEDMAEAHMQ